MKNQLSTILGSKRISMNELHKETKISRNAISGLYHEKTLNPDTKTIMTLCDYLEITPDQFFGFKTLNNN